MVLTLIKRITGLNSYFPYVTSGTFLNINIANMVLTLIKRITGLNGKNFR